MSQEIHEHIGRLYAEIADLKGRLERTVRHGTVADTDYSDPTKPRVRIAIGKKDDGSDLLGPWVPLGTMAGDRNQWHPSVLGQQLTQLAPDGDHQQAVLVHLGHSSNVPAPETDPDTHVDEHGNTKRTLKKDSLTQTVGGTQVYQTETDHKVTAPGHIQIAAGDPSAANSTDGPSHELNRFVQGSRASHDTSIHHDTALHDQMSTMVDLLVPICPALIPLQQTTLNHKSEGLMMAAQQVTSKVPDYASAAMSLALGKVGNSPISSVADIVQGDIAGQMGDLLGQIGSLVGGAGLSGGVAATAQMYLGQAQNAVTAAAAGGNADLDGALSALTSLASGSPNASMLGDAVGQLRAVMGSTSGLLSGLSGLLNGQTNASKGKIKSALFGG